MTDNDNIFSGGENTVWHMLCDYIQRRIEYLEGTDKENDDTDSN